jgi:hypothetical protein
MKKFYPGDVFVCVEPCVVPGWDCLFGFVEGSTFVILSKCTLYPTHVPNSVKIFYNNNVVFISAGLFDKHFVPLSLISFPKRKPQ